jgi:hypothetical protein
VAEGAREGVSGAGGRERRGGSEGGERRGVSGAEGKVKWGTECLSVIYRGVSKKKYGGQVIRAGGSTIIGGSGLQKLAWTASNLAS